MECLCGIGTGIVGKIAEYAVQPVGRQVGYVINYKKNLSALQSQVTELDAARESLERKIAEEERTGRKVETFVSNWLNDVIKITGEAKDLLKAERQAKIMCLNGFCPNPVARHQLSRKSTKLVQDVADLYGKKDFPNIAYDVQPEEVCVISTKEYEAFDSRTSVAKQIMDELRNDTDMIGVYGIGGVGKTTLVKEVYRQATKDKTLFDDVVMVLDVKKNTRIERIQNEIAEQLGLKFHEGKTPAGRARHLCNRIKNKKTLIILDDVWESIDLETVGLPRMATLKLLLSSRSKLVLSGMGIEKNFPLRVLDREESWSLFKETAGDIVENSDKHLIATQVAEKCGGLPLLTVTVARALRNRGLNAWNDTLRRLKRFDGEGLLEKTYSAIEWSYSTLEDEQLKSLFMLCGVVVGTLNTYLIVDLWKYSMGLGLLKDVDTIGEAWDALCSMIEQLKDSCLLQESGDIRRVRMHDLVKDVAKRIASKEQHVLSLSSASELKEWPDKEFCSKCTMISFNLCKIPEFPDVLHCPELTLFLLDGKDQQIPPHFFKEMKKLRVLDLTRLCIPLLPPSLEFLGSLRTLCLDQCTLGHLALIGQLQNLEILSFQKSKFKELPKEIGKLTRLRLLDLTGCSQLEVISPNVLSRLERLEHLRMRNSFNRWEAGGVITTARSNANLEELKKLPQLKELQLHIPNANILPPNLFTDSKLEKFQICIGSAWKWDDVDEANTALKLQLTASNQFDQGLKMLLKRTENLYLEGMEGVSSVAYQFGAEGFPKLKQLHVQNNAEFNDFTYIINGKVSYPNLTWLAVNELGGLRFLLSSSMVRSLHQLKHLQISGCQKMEEIVSIGESDEEIAENLFFCQLQDLELKDLPNLTKFFSSGSSGRLQLEDCREGNTNCEDVQDKESAGNPDIVVQHVLFDNKVEFPNLKKLSIDGLAKLTTIWNNQFSLQSSEILETIEIASCDSLRSIFPASIARNLQKLKRLIVTSCGVLVEIVSTEERQQTTLQFEFPKVTRVKFEKLPQLTNFYPGMHVSSWPSLISLKVLECFKVNKLAEEISSFQGCEEQEHLCDPIPRSLFLIHKESFPNLEILHLEGTEIWKGPQPEQHFSKLNQTLDDAFLERNRSSSAVSIKIHQHQQWQLPHLKELWIVRMTKLRQLGQEDEEDNNSQSSPNIPNLEILLVNGCDSLKNLRSSAISFDNLTTLQVSFCNGLEYLITYSMVNSLMQLTKLEVENSLILVEIVGTDEDGDSRNEITFRKLKHLKLHRLPRLQGFCSGDGIAKFPSLETSTMSNRLKLKIFSAHDQTLQLNGLINNEGEDTDVDDREALLTAEDKTNLASTYGLGCAHHVSQKMLVWGFCCISILMLLILSYMCNYYFLST